MHIGTQGTRVLLFVFIKQGNEVKRLHGVGGFLAKDGAVVLYTGKTADPGEGRKERGKPFTRRRLVGIEHNPLETCQLNVNTHHAVREGKRLGRKVAFFFKIHSGRRTHISVPKRLSGFPDVLGGLIRTATRYKRCSKYQQKDVTHI